MKKAISWFLLILLLAGMHTAAWAAAPKAPAPRQTILYTYYRQAGWGDRVQIGCVDADGGMWLLTGYDSALKWPHETKEQLDYLRTAGHMESVGQLGSEELFELKSLIISTADQGHASHPAANDAGTEYSYAVQYDRDGQACCVLLGMSGDDCFENFDPNAQALYLYLRQSFPQVTCYGGSMGPIGFQPVSIRTFCGMEGLDLSGIVVSSSYIDCEAGPRQLTVSEEDRQYLLNLIRYGKVTGKANSTATTGGTVCYGLSDQAGNFLASLELYKGLLVRSDGMYAITADPAALAEEQLLTFAINGRDYRLGVTTPAGLAADGWAYEAEWDGVYSFRVPVYESYFYAATDGGKPDDPIISINMMWADGLSASYCGFSADGNADERADSTLWDWLMDTLGAEQNADGTLVARYQLRSGNVLVIETKDTQVSLSLIPAMAF